MSLHVSSPGDSLPAGVHAMIAGDCLMTVVCAVPELNRTPLALCRNTQRLDFEQHYEQSSNTWTLRIKTPEFEVERIARVDVLCRDCVLADGGQPFTGIVASAKLDAGNDRASVRLVVEIDRGTIMQEPLPIPSHASRTLQQVCCAFP